MVYMIYVLGVQWQHCGRSSAHPSHTYYVGETAYQCPGSGN